MIDRSEYAKWLTSSINQRQSYHNHKETMAWVITALYVPSIIYLGYIEGQIWRGGWEWVAGVFIPIVGYLVWVFVRMQFDMRWESADEIKILMRHFTRLNSGEELPRVDEWKTDREDDPWPHFVCREINELKEKYRNCKEALAAFKKFHLWWRYKKNGQEEVDNRWKTEIPSYLLIIIATVFGIYLAVCN